MSLVLSDVFCLDPGLRGSGFAYFAGGELRHAAYVKNEHEGRGPPAHRAMARAVYPKLLSNGQSPVCLVEFPQVYPDMQHVKGGLNALNDLLDVAGVAAAVAAVCPSHYSVRFFLPREWKGTIAKDIMTERIRRSLTERERRCIVSVGSKDHNTLDAIGIGLHALGRLNKKVYPS